MPVVETRGILKGLLVEEAMRRQVIRLTPDASLDRCINHLIKFKVNALLITDDAGCPLGVVSKTDIVGAFYGGLPIADSRAADIMNGPPFTCFPDDELGDTLDLMRGNNIHQLFVQGAERCDVIGTLSYSDVVEILYRFCKACPKGMVQRQEAADRSDRTEFLTVRDAMRIPAISCRQEYSLARVIEELTARRVSAVLVKDDRDLPCGIISKTDIIVAYHHGLTLDAEARSIMNTPVSSCDQHSTLRSAIRQMLLKDVRQLFAYGGDPSYVVGVLSFSDAAHILSGSCRACTASRIIGTGRDSE